MSNTFVVKWMHVAALVSVFLSGCQSIPTIRMNTDAPWSTPCEKQENECAGLTINHVDSFAPIIAAANKFADVHGKSHVLLVYDIDNTLLAFNRALGSDQWFTWREDILKAQGFSKPTYSDAFKCLLLAQGNLYQLGSMRPTNDQVSQTVAQLQAAGFPSIVVTSRGPDFLVSTFKEFTRNGLAFDESGIESRFNESGVSFHDGVLFTSGKHKGEMIRQLVKNSSGDIRAIVFIDDKPKHVCRVARCMAVNRVDVATFHYTKEDSLVAPFDKKSSDLGAACIVRKRVANEWTQVHEHIRQLATLFGTADYPTEVHESASSIQCADYWDSYQQTPACSD